MCLTLHEEQLTKYSLASTMFSRKSVDVINEEQRNESEPIYLTTVRRLSNKRETRDGAIVNILYTKSDVCNVLQFSCRIKTHQRRLVASPDPAIFYAGGHLKILDHKGKIATRFSPKMSKLAYLINRALSLILLRTKYDANHENDIWYFVS